LNGKAYKLNDKVWVKTPEMRFESKGSIKAIYQLNDRATRIYKIKAGSRFVYAYVKHLRV
jgi:hypothetical protein